MNYYIDEMIEQPGIMNVIKKTDEADYVEVAGFQIQEIKIEPELLIDDYVKTHSCEICPNVPCYYHLTNTLHPANFSVGQPKIKVSTKGVVLHPEFAGNAVAATLDNGCCESHIRVHAVLGPYFCDVCGGKFKKIRGLKVHMKRHTHSSKASLYSCNICQRQFAHMWGLKIHLSAHKRGKIRKDKRHGHSIGPYECELCRRQLNSISQIKLHMRRHSYSMEAKEHRRKLSSFNVCSGPFICALCYGSFETTKAIRRHMQIHIDKLDEKVSLFRCQLCRESFQSQALLNDHRLSHNNMKENVLTVSRDNLKKTDYDHGSFDRFTCDLCHRTFKKKEKLLAHMTEFHMKEKRYKCDICSKEFDKLSIVKRHIRFSHIKEKPFTCSLCSKRFVNSYNLRLHIFTHTTEKPHKCEMCEKSFSLLKYLQSHLKVHDTKRYACKICDQIFPKGSLRKQHMHNEHQSKKM